MESKLHEVMDRRLHEAVLMCNVASLLDLLKEDESVLDSTKSVLRGPATPLHLAVLHGHVDMAREILSRKPEFTRQFNLQGSLSLHLASAKGDVQMVKELLNADSDVCLVKDGEGRIPLHTAAVNGRVNVLKELFSAQPLAARALTEKGETVLHLCASHGRLKALRLLVELLNNENIVNEKDAGDNTCLHLAAATKNIQMVKYLAAETNVDVNALNLNGFTALDVLLRSPVDSAATKKIKGILKEVGATTAKRQKDNSRWQHNTSNTLLVVAVLIATITFQAGINPPGGVWQQTDRTNGSFAGQSVMRALKETEYGIFVFFNSVSFGASLLIILLLIISYSRPPKNLMRASMFIMWVAVSSMMVCYCLAEWFLYSKNVPEAAPAPGPPLAPAPRPQAAPAATPQEAPAATPQAAPALGPPPPPVPPSPLHPEPAPNTTPVFGLPPPPAPELVPRSTNSNAVPSGFVALAILWLLLICLPLFKQIRHLVARCLRKFRIVKTKPSLSLKRIELHPQSC